ncbi:MAG: L-fucose:H+ symporter permease [Alteromonas sp.]|jgi:FHS family L-fucose permease-like MFS transporter|uniref:L-fucose:H+ symporter permease n=1 Tax=Alteromonas TaxID=226 RepID=UPI0009045BD6|nr:MULTISPECIES: L-fucose:H+ symporter permease [Alteromonas]APE06881.1 L-fucose:H+ symporter permease [Alteromonas sp. RW2A1]AUC89407.1 L-fucose:H+ symporter permease [Alteromonas sp. MB-3u-76]MAI66172.1 L-fucose:H+ symporter permease [Alteromonas sp.]|tara:strand:+ start:765 stop:2039 length:1275 start_codon:yes stop_codon:yes gene_type:complete
MQQKAPLVSRDMLLPFILLTVCFAAWGTAANMTDPLVKVFSKIFTMSSLQSALVQFSYYGAYFCLAIPAAFINKRFSYKTGVLTGLGCAILGAFMFYPASQMMTYGFFLAALFVLAGGLSILETSANPYVMRMGSEVTATRRLNFAQSFNPVGTNLGVFLAATLILPQLNQATADERSNMSADQLVAVMSAELEAVMVPYVGFASVLVVIWIAIAMMKTPAVCQAQETSNKVDFRATMGRLFKNRHYRFGVVAQFFNVAAQTCVWTFTIQYVMEAKGGDEISGGTVLQYSMLVFLFSRFVMTWIMGFIRPAALLTVMSTVATLLCLCMIAMPNDTGVWALIGISACLSLMFPTIYAIALHGLKDDAKFGAAGLVMAILGGALIPLIQAALIDNYSTALSYIVPAGCFLIVASYAVFDLRSKQRA